jgi:hypothetical protein
LPGASTLNPQPLPSNIPPTIPSLVNNVPGLNLGNTIGSITGQNTIAPGSSFLTQLQNIYGPGTGTMLGNYINSLGQGDPGVLNALIQQIQPQIQAGLATLGSTAGATGTAFGSPYGTATADYLSQVNLNEMGTAANLFQQSQNNLQQMLQGVQSDAASYMNTQGGLGMNILSSLLGTGGIGNLIGALGKVLPGLIKQIGKIFTGGGGNQPINVGLPQPIPGGTDPTPPNIPIDYPFPPLPLPGGGDTGGATTPSTPSTVSGGLPTGGVGAGTTSSGGGGGMQTGWGGVLGDILSGAAGAATGGLPGTVPGGVDPTQQVYNQYLQMVLSSMSPQLQNAFNQNPGWMTGGGGGWGDGGGMMSIY